MSGVIYFDSGDEVEFVYSLVYNFVIISWRGWVFSILFRSRSYKLGLFLSEEEFGMEMGFFV